MWSGAFSPYNMRKGGGGSFLADDGRTEDELNYPDDAEVIGTLTATLGNSGDYEWPGVTFGQYSEWADSGYSLSWINANLPIHYVGDWGWPYGRDPSK